jgi:hypothetical protein
VAGVVTVEDEPAGTMGVPSTKGVGRAVTGVIVAGSTMSLLPGSEVTGGAGVVVGLPDIPRISLIVSMDACGVEKSCIVVTAIRILFEREKLFPFIK